MVAADGVIEVFERLGLDLATASVSDIVNAVRALSGEECDALLTKTRDLLSNPISLEDRSTRIAVVKIAIALLPCTWELLLSCLDDTSCISALELHFSIFCFLDEADLVPGAVGVVTQIPATVERYLQIARTNRAHAALMAANLLGDHCDLSVGVPVLIRLATEARYAAARAAVTWGLHKAWRRSSMEKRNEILAVIEAVAANDRSSEVKTAARLVLDLIAPSRIVGPQQIRSEG